MKKIIALFVGIYGCYNISAQVRDDLSGVYHSESETYLEIRGDSLKLVEPASPGIWKETLWAECSFTWVDDNFIELNSTPPWVLVRKGMTINESTEQQIVADSIKLSLYFPNYKSRYKQIGVTLFGDSGNIGYVEQEFNYSDNNNELMLPRSIEWISISIANPGYQGGTIDGLDYGFLSCSVLSRYEIKDNLSEIKIVVPAVDFAFFQKYYVKGEYARVTKNAITWKGVTYYKKKKK